MSDDEAARREDEALKARLGKLSAALDATRKADRPPDRGAADDPSGENVGNAVSVGLRVLSEFVAGVVAGGLIGWLLDRWLGSSPAALIVFILLGTATGFWNVYRIAARPPAR